MPSAAHPFADPDKDTRLWPHSGHEVYEALNGIFGCKGHGWMNLQSAHLNLPFYDDEEFARLHAAVRLVLPLIPAIAAASPFLEGRDTGMLDSRLDAYSRHCAAVPSATGDIIPEAVSSKAQYERDIFGVIYKDLKARKAPKILFNEWVNARGAIARFDRNTIEIRLVDMQECPLANVSVVAALEQVIRNLMKHPDRLARGNQLPSAQLNQPLTRAIVQAEHTVYDDAEYLACLGITDTALTGTELWRHLLGQSDGLSPAHQACLDQILTHGTLATRMKRVVRRVTPDRLRDLCMRLCDSLNQGSLLMP
jgi:gamma-glutamyl:cysteine ligase YbdK (ATP-grasp superfamily)